MRLREDPVSSSWCCLVFGVHFFVRHGRGFREHIDMRHCVPYFASVLTSDTTCMSPLVSEFVRDLKFEYRSPFWYAESLER